MNIYLHFRCYTVKTENIFDLFRIGLDEGGGEDGVKRRGLSTRPPGVSRKSGRSRSVWRRWMRPEQVGRVEVEESFWITCRIRSCRCQINQNEKNENLHFEFARFDWDIDALRGYQIMIKIGLPLLLFIPQRNCWRSIKLNN